MKEPGGLQPMGSKKSDTTEHCHLHTFMDHSISFCDLFLNVSLSLKIFASVHVPWIFSFFFCIILKTLS